MAQPVNQKLLLVDGLNVVRRVYEANPAEDSPEKAQGAVRSSLASFRRALMEHRPTHVLAPFDYGGRTFRQDIYEQYRSSRKPMPLELREVLPELFANLHDIGIPTISVPGVEADDVVATVFRLWAKADKGPAVVVSTDKDMSVLISEGAQIRDHFLPEWRDEAWVLKKFGVPSALVHDFLSLMGDKSDDIPGVNKVGAKTAAKWLLEYKSLENLLANADAIPGKVGENLRAEVDLARLSKRLVSFKTDLSLGLTWNMLRYTPGVPYVPAKA